MSGSTTEKEGSIESEGSIERDQEATDLIHIVFEEENNSEVWKHVQVWVDECRLMWQYNYRRNIYLELFSTDMLYRHLLSIEHTQENIHFNCSNVLVSRHH